MLLACNSYITLRISNLIGQGLPCHGSRCRFESDLIRVLGYIVQIIALIGIFHNLNMYYTINIQEKLLQVGRNICYILCINTWVFDSPLFRSRALCLPFLLPFFVAFSYEVRSQAEVPAIVVKWGTNIFFIRYFSGQLFISFLIYLYIVQGRFVLLINYYQITWLTSKGSLLL